MMMRCTICGAPLDGRVCSYCGTPAAETRSAGTGFAGGCGARFGGWAAGAESAGAARREREARRAQETASCRTGVGAKNKWVALVLCLTLGWLGVHRFYTGKIGTGFLYMVTRGFWGIGIVVDLILILTDNYTDGEGLRLQE